ncbi:MAG: hypothetical protein KAR40_17665 [Candidatus Sabulitectum sp.]|nr:hypothetical protein [Candidatus Sabulitectum sp.]
MRRTIMITCLTIFLSFGLAGCKENSTGSEPVTISVTEPTSSTVWVHGETGDEIRWSGASGSQVQALLYKGGVYQTVAHGWTENDGVCGFTSQIPSSWGTGTNYQIRLEDNLDNFAWSEEFEILGNSGTISVTEPTSSTVWVHGETGDEIRWSGASGSQVQALLYKDGVYQTVAHGWTENDGVCGFSSQIPSSWGTGTNYQIRLEDNLDNFGWSEEFTIADH